MTRPFRTPAARALAVAALATLWFALALLVNPRGDFPLSDDWRFGEPIRAILDGRGFRLHPDTPMTFVGQLVLALPFAAITGFSYTATRLSTLVFAALGLYFTYRLLRELDTPNRVALLGVAALALNPTFFLLSYTSMTDVPYAAISTWAMVAYVRALRAGTWRTAIIAAALTVAATLIRQIALFPALAFAIVALTRVSRAPKLTPLAAALPLAAGILALGTYTALLALTGTRPDKFTQHAGFAFALLGPEPLPVVKAMVLRALMALAYLGLFAVPMLVACARLARGRTAALAIILIACAAAFGTGREMPWSAATFYDFGLGPLTLPDAAAGFTPAPAAPGWLWTVITLCAIAGGVAVAAIAIAPLASWLNGLRRADAPRDPAPALLAAALVIYSAPLVLTGFYDRYLLAVLPWTFGLIAVSAGAGRGTSDDRLAQRRQALAWGLVAVVGFFAIAGTRDYLAWNRARWQAIDYLMKDLGAAPLEIDGGYEFNGPRRPIAEWERANARYRVAMTRLPHHRELRAFPFARVLGSDGAIFALAESTQR